jgi:hypothetical protein
MNECMNMSLEMHASSQEWVQGLRTDGKTGK